MATPVEPVHVLLCEFDFASKADRDAWAAAWRPLADRVLRDEPDCLSYEMAFAEKDDDFSLIIYERYVTRAALDGAHQASIAAHRATPGSDSGVQPTSKKFRHFKESTFGFMRKAAMPPLPPAVLPASARIPRRTIRRLGAELSVIGFPGIIMAEDRFKDPAEAKRFVETAVGRGITYIDIAPLYGDGLAQHRLGPALESVRDQCFVACKTAFRDAASARKDLELSLKEMRTGHFDLFQLHSITSAADVDQALGPGGCMDMLEVARRDGKVRALGFSAHDEDQALRLIATKRFDTVLFPVNFLAITEGGVGSRLLDAANAAGMGVMAIKAMAKCRLRKEDSEVGVFDPRNPPKHQNPEQISTMKAGIFPVCVHPKYRTWYTPEIEPVWMERLLRFTLSREGVTAAITPGSSELFEVVLNFIQEGWAKRSTGDGAGSGSAAAAIPPFDEETDLALLKGRYAGKGLCPIFHRRDEAGNLVTHATQ